MLATALDAMRRRWYVVLVVFVAFAAGGGYLAMNAGTYYARVVVWFTADEAATFLPDNGSRTSDMIAYAGTIATQLNEGRAPETYATEAAPYYGAGVREGVLVVLRDAGGQWSTWYDTAAIELHIVGPTTEWVAEQRDAKLAEIEEVARERLAAGTSRQEVTVAVEPTTTEIAHIVPSRLQFGMAFAALAGAAVIVAGTLAMWTDVLVRPRGRGHGDARGYRVAESEALT